ncbi:response regulator [Niabella yanshanensis]|uniref:Response regulator n=1 Tax=Niabella yanshanensis TaxID=577386 RepID=A0ABZ0WB49_9BACT|nr:response regulator [Niabella yanshanensis]WQD38792.1 response regulator [Niabella yanshanensis]
MSAKKLILIVDDDYVYKLVTSRMIHLCCTEAKIICATNGLEALEIIESPLHNNSVQMPDIILLDIEMPGMNGWEFLHALSSFSQRRVEKPDIYIVSSSIDEVDEERMRIYPAVKELLVKPFSAAKLGWILNQKT